MAQPKRKVYLVKYQMNGEMTGVRCHDEQEANETAAALKRTGYKHVRVVTKSR